MDFVSVAIPIAGVSARLGPSCGRALALSLTDVPWWAFAGLLLVAAVGYVVLTRLRRSVVQGPAHDPISMNLEQLDEFREQGLLTEDEYRRGRRAVLAGLMPMDVAPPEKNEGRRDEQNGPSAADEAVDPPEAENGGDSDPPAG